MKNADVIRGRIMSRELLAKQVSIWKFLGKKIVFTNGCFDILHPGHVDYLSRAADLGDVLIVGVNADVSVRTLNKGVTRPIQDENSRAFIIASLKMVKAVCVFEESTPLELIRIVQPDVLVKGGDWKVDQIVGADIVKANGGEVHSIDFLPGYSTTSIENKILGGK